MIILPTAQELETLKAFAQDNCLSIYLPYIAPNSSDNPNRIQLKNSLKEARGLLRAKKMSSIDIDKILYPAQKLIDGEEFQSTNPHSIALFIGRDFFARYHLPVSEAKSLLVVSKTFEMEPIMQLIKTEPE